MHRWGLEVRRSLHLQRNLSALQSLLGWKNSGCTGFSRTKDFLPPLGESVSPQNSFGIPREILSEVVAHSHLKTSWMLFFVKKKLKWCIQMGIVSIAGRKLIQYTQILLPCLQSDIALPLYQTWNEKSRLPSFAGQPIYAIYICYMHIMTLRVRSPQCGWLFGMLHLAPRIGAAFLTGTSLSQLTQINTVWF